jgi:tetratricopeptide (TPR) repeat protein
VEISMKYPLSLFAVAFALSASAPTGATGTKGPAPQPSSPQIPFAAKSDAARDVKDALALVESMAPGPKIRAAAEKAIAADADVAIAHYLIGTTYWGDEAKPHMEKATALAAKASEPERAFIAAGLLQRDRKNDEALAAFKALQEKWPGDPLVAEALADVYQSTGNIDEARKAAELAVKMAPESARAHALLGGTLLLKDDYAGARAAFEAAIARLAEGAAPTNVYFGITQSYVYQGKSALAIETLRTFVNKYRSAPGNTFPEVFIWNAMARIQLESGDAKSAIDTYAKGFESVIGADLPARDKKIWEGRLHHGRGRSLAQMGRHKEAWAEAEIVKKMIDAAGDDAKEFVPAYHYLAGYLKLQAGETPEAIEELKLAQDHDDPFRALLLARAYEKAGDKTNAHATYEKVVATKRNSLERALSYPEAKKKL